MPLKSFGFRSLVGRKHHADDTADDHRAMPPPRYGHTSASSTSGVHTTARSTHVSNGRLANMPPAPPRPAQVHEGGFCSAVQYERLTTSPTPSGSSGVLPPAHTLASSPNVLYERLTPPVTTSSPNVLRRPSPNVAPAALRRESPFGFSPALSIPSLYSPGVLPTPSPSMLSSLGTASASATPLPLDRESSGSLSAGAATSRLPKALYRNSLSPAVNTVSPDIVMDSASSRASTPAQGGNSDTSTPFSAVMEEWMSQLRTPTPDVTLLPTPSELINRASPASHEEMSELRRVRDPLLPTPPPDMRAQKLPLKNGDYVLAAQSPNNGPLEEAITTLCRDLIAQELNKRLGSVSARLSSISLDEQREAVVDSAPAMVEIANDISETTSECDDTMSVTSRNGTGTKSKRRKMCTVEGCNNLSRSRGLCKAHGGGRRCSVEGCTRASQSGSLCITHGGGKRCTVPGCQKAAQSRGMCKAHGGGVRCRVEGCSKSSQGDGFCRTHGGGRRCGHPSGCNKWAQRNGMCMAHSEGRYGNSYRGRLARMQEEEQRKAAETLTAAKDSVEC